MGSIFIVIKDGSDLYYLLKVVLRSLDIYCIPPHLGWHYSLHESGEAHFRFEGKAAEPGEELPVALVEGEAGIPIGRNIIRAPLSGLGRASRICVGIYPITSLNDDYKKFNRSEKECFVIDTALLPTNTKFIEIGVWTVPIRNPVIFENNYPNILADLLYKVDYCEPQIWIYAQPILQH